jgi:hypothetical protein
VRACNDHDLQGILPALDSLIVILWFPCVVLVLALIILFFSTLSTPFKLYFTFIFSCCSRVVPCVVPRVVLGAWALEGPT